MRILFIGDIVGTPGLNMVKKAVPFLREREGLDLVVANAENTSGGSGLYPNAYKQLREAGIDALTMGAHNYKRSDRIEVMLKDEPISKPANYPEAAPGKDHLIVTAKDGTRVEFDGKTGTAHFRAKCPNTDGLISLVLCPG